MDNYVIALRTNGSCRIMELTERTKHIEDYGTAAVYGIRLTEWKPDADLKSLKVEECDDVSAVREEAIEILFEISKKAFDISGLTEEVAAAL